MKKLEEDIDDIIAANPDKVEQARAKPQLVGWFVGQVMKSRGGGDYEVVNDLLRARIGILTDDDFRSISSAPRDGTLIEVHDPECGTFPMRWSSWATNPQFPGVVGFWVSPSGDVTWNEAGGCGPTLWRPYRPGRYLH